MVMRRRKSSCPDIERRTSFGSDRGRNGVKLDLFIEDDDLFTNNPTSKHRTPSPTNLSRHQSNPASPDKRSNANIEDYAEEVLCLRILSTRTRYRFGHIQINLVSPAFVVDKLFNVEFDQDSQVSLIKSQQNQQNKTNGVVDNCCLDNRNAYNGNGNGKSATIVISPDNEDFNMNPNLTAVNAELTIVEEPAHPCSRGVSLNVSQTSLSRTPEGDENEDSRLTKDKKLTNNDHVKITRTTSNSLKKCSSNGALIETNNSDSPSTTGRRKQRESTNKASMRRMSLFQLSSNCSRDGVEVNGTPSKKHSTGSITASPAHHPNGAAICPNRFESIRLYANLDSNSMFEPINLETGVEKFNQNVNKIKKNKKCRALSARRHTHYYYSTSPESGFSSAAGNEHNNGNDASFFGADGLDDASRRSPANSANLKRFMAKKVTDTWHSAVRVKKNIFDSFTSWKGNSVSGNSVSNNPQTTSNSSS